jgi:hypothetical protein
MSAYVTLATPMLDVASIRCALESMGIPSDAILEQPHGVEFSEYRGSGPVPKVHLVVRGQALGGDGSNVGLERTSTGYRLHMSDSRSRDRWQLATELPKRYAVQHQRRLDAMAFDVRRAEEERRATEQRALVGVQRERILEKARKLGYAVSESVVDGRVRLVLTRSAQG